MLAGPPPDRCHAGSLTDRTAPVESQVTAAWHPDPVLEPRFRWSFPQTHPIDSDLLTAALDHGLAERMTGLLARRGVLDRDGLVAWFAEPLAGLHDPRLLPDAERVVDRLTTARDRGERVMVFEPHRPEE